MMVLARRSQIGQAGRAAGVTKMFRGYPPVPRPSLTADAVKLRDDKAPLVRKEVSFFFDLKF